MAWKTRRTYVVGEKISSADLNLLSKENDEFEARLKSLERHQGLVEAEVSMAWAVIDWANSEGDEQSDPELDKE